MSVSIIWSSTNGGSAMSEPLDHGSGSDADPLTAQEVFVRHDGDNPLTDCGFYLDTITSYSGSLSAVADLAEILAWGDSSDQYGFGGFQLNMNAVGLYPSSSWPTYSSKFGAKYNVFRTGTGDSAANKIVLPTSMGLSGSAGTIQAGATPNVRFKCKVVVPFYEDTVGVRQFDQKMRYTYTS